MASLWHLPNMEICKLDARVYMHAHIFNKTFSSGPPCCFGVVRLVLSIHDSYDQLIVHIITKNVTQYSVRSISIFGYSMTSSRWRSQIVPQKSHSSHRLTAWHFRLVDISHEPLVHILIHPLRRKMASTVSMTSEVNFKLS